MLMATFDVEKEAEPLNPRLGSLSIPGRPAVPTPHYIANTSRGVVPHLSQDNLERHSNINGLYVGLEDFIEKAPQETPPVFSTPCGPRESPLRRFIAVQDDQLLVLGPRRVPALDSPGSNTNTGIQIHTSVGHRSLPSEYYASAATKLRPDIVVGLGDVMHGHANPSLKRVDKMGDRTTEWTKDLIAATSYASRSNGNDSNGTNGNATSSTSNSKTPAIFAPILPIEAEQQSYYVNDLKSSSIAPKLSGLALYSTASIDVIPSSLSHLPLLSLSDPPTPAKLLREISLGVDLFVLPFVDKATDAGLILTFAFPAPQPSPTGTSQNEKKSKTPLGIDAWAASHATSLSPPVPNCPCYTCTHHHRAYIHHLLAAKEMLGWVLLQLHNHSVLSRFFAGVRATLSTGADAFEREVDRFERVYEEALPQTTGAGPRVRGYMFRSRGAGEARRNERGFARGLQVDDADAVTPGEVGADAGELVQRGFAGDER
ncbi:tRNA-guanine transglycosylase family protein [Phyllosticta capitalensis]